MTSEVVAHYEGLLAEHYSWMLGDFGQLVADDRRLIERHPPTNPQFGRGTALDLGCGSGVQSIALAELGHETVIGVDISPTLIAELRERSAAYPAIRPIQADLCAGLDTIVEPQTVDIAVCLGDTLPHLPSRAAVRRLVDDVLTTLVPDGTLLLGFRDLSTPLTGLDRFIPVRSDRDRIMTCFLEDEGDAVRVHDLIHTPDGHGGWSLATSSYRKLRLSPSWVVDQLDDAGFGTIAVEHAPRGMCLISARRPTEELS